MLPRDAQESARLDKQHKFQREIVGGHLIHPSIPKHKLRAFADVGTGTGIWLRELAQEHDAVAGKETTYVGFDISTQQFPKETPKGIDFVVHDVCEPFPDKYHGSFDLVHVRFLSFALKAQYLGETISNIVKILSKQRTKSQCLIPETLNTLTHRTGRIPPVDGVGCQ